jgi:WD40 repeat protein
MNGVEISSDGSLAISWGPGGTIVAWDAATGKPMCGWKTWFPAPAPALSPDGRRLFLRARVLRVMDPRTGEYLQPDSERLEWAGWRAHCFSADGRLLFCTTVGQVGTVLDGTTGNELSRFDVFKGAPDSQKGIKTCAIFPDGGTCLALSVIETTRKAPDHADPRPVQRGYHRCLQWWNLQTGQLDRSVELPDETMSGRDTLLALSDDGKTIALGLCGGRDWAHTIQLRSATDGNVVREIAVEGTWHHFACLAFTRGDKTITAAVVGAKKTFLPDDRTSLGEWDVASRAKLRTFEDTQWKVAEISNRANRVMYLSDADKVKFFDAESWRPLGEPSAKP